MLSFSCLTPQHQRGRVNNWMSFKPLFAASAADVRQPLIQTVSTTSSIAPQFFVSHAGLPSHSLSIRFFHAPIVSLLSSHSISERSIHMQVVEPSFLHALCQV